MAKLSFSQTLPETQLSPLTKSLEKRAATVPVGMCPLTLQLALLETSSLQSCGKCVPCSEGLVQLTQLLRQVVNCTASEKTLETLKRTAQMVYDTADCVIGYEAAERVLEGLELFAEEYDNHIKQHHCALELGHILPCESACPAHVDIPAYVALAAEGRYEEALGAIRQDNPFPTACAYICENPCENSCRRSLIDSPLNIRGIKRFIVDKASSQSVPVPAALPQTGKEIAVIGGGPSGLSCAYYLALMGHSVRVFEQRNLLGGMLRFGIPAYRLPRQRLDEDIAAILSAGNIEVFLNTEIEPEGLGSMLSEFDAVYMAIGAQSGNDLGIEGSSSEGVVSAIDLLAQLSEDEKLDYTGKSVVVIGGGNVAMDCARTAVRAGAAEVSIVYRRRKEDMPALESEIEGTLAEGVELITLEAPVSVQVNEDGHCTALITQPQIIGEIFGGRPTLSNAQKPQRTHKADVILVAIGQSIESERFGLSCTRGRIDANEHLEVEKEEKLFTGGDCFTGPASAIKAIAAGKVAARNIDEFLGYHHSLDYSYSEDAPPPLPNNRKPMGRIEIAERPARERKHDFKSVELPLSQEEAEQECSRCLRCDYFGSGVLEGGRTHHA